MGFISFDNYVYVYRDFFEQREEELQKFLKICEDKSIPHYQYLLDDLNRLKELKLVPSEVISNVRARYGTDPIMEENQYLANMEWNNHKNKYRKKGRKIEMISRDEFHKSERNERAFAGCWGYGGEYMDRYVKELGLKDFSTLSTYITHYLHYLNSLKY